VLIGGGTAYSLLSGNDKEQEKEQEEKPEKPEKEEAETAAVDKDTIIGMNVHEAAAFLEGQGFTNVDLKQGSPASDAEVDLVTNESPSGSKVELTKTIVLTHNTAYGDASAPESAPSAPSEVTVGDTFTVQGISSPGSCPSGLSASYEVIVDPTSVASLTSGVNNGSVQMEAKSAGSVSISYQVACSRDG